MEKAENSFESLLSAAHVAFVEVITTNTIKVELAERVPHVVRLDDPIFRVILSCRSLHGGLLHDVDGVMTEQVLQAAEQTNSGLIDCFLGLLLLLLLLWLLLKLLVKWLTHCKISGLVIVGVLFIKFKKQRVNLIVLHLFISFSSLFNFSELTELS